MTVGRRDYYIAPGDSLWERDPIPGQNVQLLVGFKQSLGAYSLIKYTTSAVNPKHTHQLDDESAYLLEGSLSVVVGDETYDLEPGGFVYMPRNVPHQFIPHGTATALSIQAPGGVMDSLIEDVGGLLVAGMELTDERYHELQHKHGIVASDAWYRSFARQDRPS
jgi:quercetin dioxygenase-like cupin family protein